MAAFFKWVYKWLRKLAEFVGTVINLLTTVASSVLAWVVAGIAWLIDLFLGWIGDSVYNFFAQWQDVTIGELPVYPLADYIARDVLALDVAYTCLLLYFSVWLSVRVARLGFTFIKFVLELL